VEPGDLVRIKSRKGDCVGILVSKHKKKYMVGPVLEVMVNGEIIWAVPDTVERVEED